MLIIGFAGLLIACPLQAQAQTTPEAPPQPPSAVEEPAPESDDGLFTAGIILMVTGGVTAMIGTTIGVVAAAQYADLDCPRDVCAPAVFEDAEDYNQLREPSGLTIAAGGVMAAIGGAFLYAVLTDPGEELGWRIELGPTAVQLRGSF